MLDLETVQASIDRWHGLNTEDAMALVAELRAAQEVVDEYRSNRLHLMRNGIITVPSVALAAYDKVTGENQ